MQAALSLLTGSLCMSLLLEIAGSSLQEDQVLLSFIIIPGQLAPGLAEDSLCLIHLCHPTRPKLLAVNSEHAQFMSKGMHACTHE